MDITERKITKIAREAEKFTVKALRAEGVGTAELDFIHAVRHSPGITQAEVRRQLNIDRGAAAKRTSALEAKGYLRKEADETDGRLSHLYATEKAESLKSSKAAVETVFYSWLTETLTGEEKEVFATLLDRLYLRSKEESRAGFPELSRLTGGTENEEKQ